MISHTTRTIDPIRIVTSGQESRVDGIPACLLADPSATRTAPFKLAASPEKNLGFFDASKWLVNGLNDGRARGIATGACLDASPRAPCHRADQNHRSR